jgi:hypothetical protein
MHDNLQNGACYQALCTQHKGLNSATKHKETLDIEIQVMAKAQIPRTEVVAWQG